MFFVENEGLPKMSKNMNKRALLSARALRQILYLSSWQFHLCIVKGIIDDIIKTAVKTAEVDDQKSKYLQHFIDKHDTIVSN